jgi:phosphatidate cytidylyltransferase
MAMKSRATKRRGHNLESRPLKDFDSDSPATESSGIPDKKKESKFQGMYVRTISGAAFVLLFTAIIYLGHLYCLGLLLILQILITKELFILARQTANMRRADERKELPGFRFQQWYIFSVASFYMYGRLLHDIVLTEITGSSFSPSRGWKIFLKGLWVVLKRHMLITYCLYVIGFVMSVLSLKKGKLMYQFGQYSWTITIILFVLVQTSFFVSNIFDGLIWFVLPCTFVIVNDIMAYFAGKAFGRTPLIKLSPKKTWEGFIGGATLTVLLSIPLSDYLSNFDWMTCSRSSFAKERLDCRYTEAFTPTAMHLSDIIPSFLIQLVTSEFPASLDFTFVAKPIIVHGVILALFASSIAPFGGFFASGIKRALKVKDFGDSIPGHGGLTDRMDCQCVMGVFAYVYFNNFVKQPVATTSYILDRVMLMDSESQINLFTRMGYLLAGQDLLPQVIVSELNKLPMK